MDSGLLCRIENAVGNLDAENLPKLCTEALSAGIPASEIVVQGLAKGLEIVGQKFEKGELFVSDLIFAGDAAKEAMAILEPHFVRTEGAKKGPSVVIGTVEGDLHDLGKNLTATLLKAAGFEVTDLGSDVPVKRFSEEVERVGARILGMSALLTTTMVNMGSVIEDLEQKNVRRSVKVIIGGAPVDSQFATKIRADAAAKDALEGVQICRSWTK